ncbi:hypothetical protein [Komagataeibacter europaeus]|uniref:hypothetical protein n=1 Tax=Komagataeibacter europaeus TaxID=33995 RepID=UPI00035EA77A|nr:hypothetical protein [Komagataeibacter europaeus]GBQ45146.1 hypothetical protein AA18890_2372 [Komagataeibacter europaeus LMG 18890]
MEYLKQIAEFPSLVIGPAVVASLFSGLFLLWIAYLNRRATTADVERKIEFERELNDAKFGHENDKALTDRAWADYGIRRDVYLELAEHVGSLYGKTTTREEKARFHIAARKVRVVGSDEVVLALNAFTASIKNSQGPEAHELRLRDLMNAIRIDIRTLNEKPPQGTTLDASAFPIES